jgi:hypothetical protein
MAGMSYGVIKLVCKRSPLVLGREVSRRLTCLGMRRRLGSED